MGSVDTRKLLSDAIDRWDRWAGGEMFLAERLHPRAKAMLIEMLTEEIAAGSDVPVSKPKGKKAGA